MANPRKDDSYFQAPPQLPPETYNYLIHALLSLQSSSSHPPTYPLPNYNHPWPSPPIPTGPLSFYPIDPPIPFPPHHVPHSAGSSQLTPSPPASTAQDPEGSEDGLTITEDKRRRNTAASARFRVKRKLKTLNLEHTVTDLTGRSEDLEREAADLRRENAWLKEIVLLKGRNLAGSHALAPGNRHDDDGKDEPQPESSVSRRVKGKDKES